MNLKPLEELFRARVITFLASKGLLPVARANMLRGWVHSGFNVHRSRRVLPDEREDIERLAQHIPDKSFQLVRYYGWYSNKMRGQRDNRVEEEAEAAGQAVQIIDVSQHQPRRSPSVKWRELIKKVWQADPLLCPKCQKEMRIVALINERDVIDRILRHLGLWEQGVRVLPPRAPSDCAGRVSSACFAATRPFCPHLDCIRNALEAGIDITSPILLHFHHESAASDRFQRAGARAA